ncbi:MAG: IS1595 family transposase [Pseudomonadales bacterium]|nr:IS1595 family transposase [Pseudomonadales bacterium]
MAKNKVQFQKGYSLVELFRDYGSEDQCRQALYNWKWPQGFSCPECSSRSFCELKSRPLFQCNRCHHQTSITSGTLFAGTKLPLRTWFLAIHLLTQCKTGLSALALKRQLGVSYNTAWAVKHKVMQAMKERENRQPLSGFIQIDDVYWGGKRTGGKRGRGSSNKTSFVAAVEVNEDGRPIKMNMNVVEGFTLAAISRWSKAHLSAGSSVVSDGLACFSAVQDAKCQHFSIVTGGGPGSVEIEAFKWVNTMISNLKNSMKGAYHSVNSKHLPRYLAEFCYRFNRRFKLQDLLPRFIYVALRTPPIPYRMLKMAEAYG